MGSFDVACVISDLTIRYGDKVGFMLIDESQVVKAYRARDLIPEAGWIHYGLEFDGYKPYLPPVFGEYDDYGHVVNVEDSQTTQFIEKLFRKPIEIVIKCVGSNRDIYSSHGAVLDHYFTGDKSFSEYGANTKESLLALGFTHSVTTGGRDSFHFDGYEIVTVDDKAENYIIRDVSTERVVLDSFYARDLEKLLSIFGHYTHRYPGFDPEDYWAIRKLYSLSGTFFLKDVYTKMSTGNVVDSYRVTRFEELKAEWQEFREFILDPANERQVAFMSGLDYKFDTIQNLTRDTAFDYEKLASLVEFDDPAEIWRTIEIRNILDSVNKVLLPNHCGEQHGNDEASDYLAKISRKILKKRRDEEEY